jgi:hypothetical protein
VAAPSPAPAFANRLDYASRDDRQAVGQWLRSPWIWASMGGVAVGLTFFLVFLVVRSGPTPTQASVPQAPAQILTRNENPAAAAPTVTAAAAPVYASPAPIPATPAVISSTPAAAANYAPRTIDLLALIDPDKHTLGGNWRKEKGALISDHSSRAKICIPYRPPEEYDFKIEFTRIGIDNCVTQMFTHRNSAALILGGWKGTATGFQQLKGKSANSNETTVLGIQWEAGKRHTSVVKVRKTGLEAWLDGQRICVYGTNGWDLNNRDWPISDAWLGVGSEVSPTVFHAIELIENPR